MNDAQWTAVIKLAADKLSELGILRSELDRFINADEITAAEITAVFERTRQCTERIAQIDRQLGEASLQLRCEPELSQLLDDQRALARKIVGMTRIAYEKAERLSDGCRTGLAGISQKKWIMAQFASRSVEPGILLDYSEKTPSPKKT
jgi:hypothetical protein